MESSEDYGEPNSGRESRTDAVSFHAAPHEQHVGGSRGAEGSPVGTSTAGGAGPTLTPTRRPSQLRSLLSQFSSSFTRHSDVSQRGRLHLTITSTQEEPPTLVPQGRPPSAGGLPSPRQVEQHQQRNSSGGSNNDAAIEELGAVLVADAERHRLLAAGIDIRAVAVYVEQYAPFAFLLLLVFLWQHLLGIVLFSWLTWTLSRINGVLRQQVALKADLKPQALLAAGGVVVAQLPIVALSLRRQPLAELLLLHGRPADSFWDTLFLVVTTDVIVRFATVLLKVREAK